MDYTGLNNMDNTDESKIATQEIRDNVTTYMKNPVPEPKEETFTMLFVRTYITSLLGLNVVVTSTFAGAWALIAKVFVLKSALPLGTQLLLSEAQIYLKKAEANLEEIGDGIKHTVQKVSARIPSCLECKTISFLWAHLVCSKEATLETTIETGERGCFERKRGTVSTKVLEFFCFVAPLNLLIQEHQNELFAMAI